MIVFPYEVDNNNHYCLIRPATELGGKLMRYARLRWPGLLALAVVVFGGGRLAAGDLYGKGKAPKSDTVVLPKASEVHALTAHPATVTLKGIDDSQQLVLTATLTSGLVQDLSSDVKYEIANPKVARVTTLGRVIPLENGSTTITASYGEKKATISLTTQSCDVSLPINFANQIVPIFTKLGCNSGGCHGKSGGQNGFALSLLGFVPEVDYNSLVKEARGRRLLPYSPENSLLLLKATGQMAHAGGKRMEVGSDEYKLIRRWIAAGTPFGEAKDPVVTRISAFPEQRILTRNNKQQIAIYAHYSDGSVQDVTQRAQYESNDTEIAIVDGAGMIRSLEMSGQAAIMARYQGQVTVFRTTVPLGQKIPEYTFEHRTVVDKHTHQKWQELGIVPSDLCSDGQFIRRVSLDLTGTLPTPKQVKDFVESKDAKKREKLIDALLETPEYAYYFANKWADILRVKRQQLPNRAPGTFAFHDWIRKSIAQDKPYDQFVREILTASGDERKAPPTVWYKEIMDPQQFVDDVGQVFLGQRLACAQCHHHPYEKWSQDDYWGIAAFYGRVGRKNFQIPGGFQGQQDTRQVIFRMSSGNVTNKRTGQPAIMKPLDGDPVKVDAEDDPRQKLVDWMVAPKNPFFARAVANRYWAHFFGRGIVDPLDDMRVTNPPSNPALLDALAQDLIASKYSLKQLIRTICNSRTYQLGAIPNEFNKHDKQAFARFYPRRMSAEVLYDAVSQVTGAPGAFGGLPRDRHAPTRAIMLPDESFASYFLDVFGRPQRLSACECERVSEANLTQALHLLNSDEIQGKLQAGGGRVDLLVKDKRSDKEKIEELFLWTFARPPSAEDLQVALEHIQKHAANKAVAYQDILWALVNTKEFCFNQ
jgi:hypothetical protein